MIKIFIILISIFFIINTVLFFTTNNSTNNSDVNIDSTVFIIREFDFPSEWRNSEIKYAEVTREELNQYPTLKKTINGEGCTKYDENLWRCKVDTDEWNITNNFINNKENIDTCIKIGGNCYSIDFVICCTNNIEIESIVPLCTCDDGEIYLEENDTNSMIIITIQNNQSLGTDMLTLSINIKNSSNITVSKLDSDTRFYIKDNSSLSSFATMNIPGPGEYEIEVKIFEDEEIIAQRSVAIDVKGIMTASNDFIV